eukprot:TRINITY_DN14309_c0_g1_i1.p1 TRINITY_DN14309_c0_g1~~TRINITY_DN14309_c0_g1_i1.p1  ORF type:complete len:160 (+),score=3.26 TRINITY_DN14309_c0_g1_i1:474-953(+)
MGLQGYDKSFGQMKVPRDAIVFFCDSVKVICQYLRMDLLVKANKRSICEVAPKFRTVECPETTDKMALRGCNLPCTSTSFRIDMMNYNAIVLVQPQRRGERPRWGFARADQNDFVFVDRYMLKYDKVTILHGRLTRCGIRCLSTRVEPQAHSLLLGAAI